MALVDYAGQDGIIFSYLGKQIPGIYLFVFILAIAFIIYAIVRMRSFEEHFMEGVVYAIIGGILSFLLIGNMFALIFIAGMIVGVQILFKEQEKAAEYGTRAERRMEKEEGFQPRAQVKIVKKEHSIERAVEDEGKEGKVTAEAAELEEDNVALEGHESALAAGVAKISESMEEMDKAEIGSEERDVKVLLFAHHVNDAIKKHGLETAADEGKKKWLLSDLQEMVKAVRELVNDAKYSDEYRARSVKAIEQAVKAMTAAAKNAERIERNALKVEKRLRKDADNAVKDVQNELDDNIKRVDSLKTSRKKLTGAVDAAVRRNIKKLESQRMWLLKQRQTIEKLNDYLKTVLTKLKRVLKKLKDDAKAINHTQDDIEELFDKIRKLESYLGGLVEEMADEDDKFGKAIDSLSKDALPESIAVTATASVGSVFGALMKLMEGMISFNKDEIHPFIEKNAELIKEAWQVQAASEYCNIFSMRLNAAFEELDKMAAAVIQGQKAQKALQKDIQAEELEKQISHYAEQKGIRIKNKFKQSFDKLGAATASLNKQIDYLSKEKARVEQTQKETLESLNTVMDELTKMRKKQFEQFQEHAGDAQAQLAKAKREERKAKSAT
jgi:hypothetical protein